MSNTDFQITKVDIAGWVAGGVVALFGFVGLLLPSHPLNGIEIICLLVFGGLLATGHRIAKIAFGKDGGTFETGPEPRSLIVEPPVIVDKKVLPPAVVETRRAKIGLKPFGSDGGPFHLLEPSASERPVPGSDPTIPMYRLDREYRIIDWNDAFTLAFDRVMEGRRGESALEWVFFLENFEQVYNHGKAAFADPANLPRLDVETLVYQSQRYGRLTAEKRAYQIPGEDGSIDSWLCLVDLKFPDEGQAIRYQLDLISLLGEDLLWSEYAVYYDRVLMNTQVYPELLALILGETDVREVRPIPPRTRVLDLGAGTGNITQILADPSCERTVVALEKNRMMLNALRYKCRAAQLVLRNDDKGPGIFATRQDVTNLFGLTDNNFDVAILNNVLYAVGDPQACLQEVHRVLRPGGEIRVTGPRKDSDVDALFAEIKKELEDSGKFKDVEKDYLRVEWINKVRLKNVLFKWSIQEVERMLLQAGFSKITYGAKAYYDQGMLVCAVK